MLNARHRSCPLGASLLLSLFTLLPHAVADVRSPVASLKELRQQHVVMQQWDLSCGAAALATILRFQHGERLTERDIALQLMSRPEYLDTPELVRYREGFSLLDLKRFVDEIGYNGIGLGNLTLDTALERTPLIVPIRTHGYNHYVVLVGALGNRVLFSDPAYGTRTMTRPQFELAWVPFEDVGRVGFLVKRTDGLIAPNRLLPDPSLFLTLEP